MKAKAKGARSERKARDILKDLGYTHSSLGYDSYLLICTLKLKHLATPAISICVACSGTIADTIIDAFWVWALPMAIDCTSITA
jgi:hypothetical protein